MYNSTLSDMETCYKMIRADVLKDLSLTSDGFSIEPEITAKLLKRKLRIYEMPIAYYGRTYEEGKKITWRDGFEAIWDFVQVPVSHLRERVGLCERSENHCRSRRIPGNNGQEQRAFHDGRA